MFASFCQDCPQRVDGPSLHDEGHVRLFFILHHLLHVVQESGIDWDHCPRSGSTRAPLGHRMGLNKAGGVLVVTCDADYILVDKLLEQLRCGHFLPAPKAKFAVIAIAPGENLALGC
jgi:hypothetical protein